VIEACPVSADGGVADCPTTSGVADMICVPPYWGGTVSLGFAQGSADLGTEPAKAYVPTTGGAAESKDSGGCQFAPGGKQSGLGTLFGLGALALGFSRRRRGATA
jgi:MYXO-CTERM domain-containing protein